MSISTSVAVQIAKTYAPSLVHPFYHPISHHISYGVENGEIHRVQGTARLSHSLRSTGILLVSSTPVFRCQDLVWLHKHLRIMGLASKLKPAGGAPGAPGQIGAPASAPPMPAYGSAQPYPGKLTTQCTMYIRRRQANMCLGQSARESCIQ